MRVAVVGAGASGLACIKTCLEEGLQPVCFEQTDAIGGLWQFTEDENRGCVYRNTVINTSKEMNPYSDFPLPREFPPYQHYPHMLRYFEMYAGHFDLNKHIRLEHEVVALRQKADFHDSGKWEVDYRDLRGQDDGPKPDAVRTEVFDAVMVSTGHHASPAWPSFPGMEEFTGVKIHSHTYKDFKKFVGKKVLVVGIGNSGGDIVVELSHHASQAYLSTRRGAWVLSRLSEAGVPVDQFFNTRFSSYLPTKVKEHVIMGQLSRRFDHESVGLRPKHSFFRQHLMVNDALPHRILLGSVIVKPNVSRFTKTGVVFDDGSVVEQLDAVVFCTGYNVSFDFIDQSMVQARENKVTLYKYIFPPHHARPTLAVIGCYQPNGAHMPMSEIQARWSVRVFMGKSKLPSERAMMEDINKKRDEMAGKYYASKRHTIEVDYISYCDEIAELIGCRPNLWKLLIQDPSLAYKCFFGPCVPAQWRLMGPHSWAGAKKVIEDAPENVFYATRKRVLAGEEERGGNGSSVFTFLLLPAVLILVVLLIAWAR